MLRFIDFVGRYIPGTVGLNNLKNTAYLNVIVQVRPLWGYTSV